jgi:RNA polymerase sigma-70 factor (ECF subfamily)
MEQCYRDHFGSVDGAVRVILSGADRETVVHEVFLRLLSDKGLRRRFEGGSLGAWLRVVARNQAIDYARRRRLEIPFADAAALEAAGGPREDGLEQRASVRLALERFRAEILPRKWEPVFVARFVEQQDQPSAARALGMSRTTLAYQEYRIRKLLRRFMLRGDRP